MSACMSLFPSALSMVRLFFRHPVAFSPTRCRLLLVRGSYAHSMNRTLLFILILSVSQIFAADSSPPCFLAISDYLVETTHRYDVHDASGGCTHYVVPAEIAALIDTRTIYELLAAIILDVDDPSPTQLGRIA